MTRMQAIAVLIALSGHATAIDKIGVYFDAAATLSSIAVAPGGQVDAWVVLTDLSANQTGVNYGLSWSAGLSLVAAELLVPNSLNVGTSSNVNMGFGVCLSGTNRAIYRYTFQLPTSGSWTDLHLQVGNSQPCSFGGLDCMTYTNCSAELLWLSYAQNGGDSYSNGSAIINPSHEPPLSRVADSFGALKAQYR